MKISFNWLKEFVDVADDPRTLGNRLTLVGLAVDSLQSGNDDTLFEFDVTTNRPDCLNHLGIAREVAAINGAALRKPTFTVTESDSRAEDAVSISIADSDLCKRYCARYLANVKIGPSPDWLKLRLEQLGIRSINNVADVTNYVMMELGQPLHAFDADTLSGQQVIVRRAEIDERLSTLDGVERRLNPSILVIADAERPIALAGIMGGVATEISGKTVNVLLESAHFNPLAIRKAARGLNMNTEASYRFERGADVEMANYACDRAAALIRTVAGGAIYKGVIDVYPEPSQPIEAVLRRERIPLFLGGAVDDQTVEHIFSRLEFQFDRTADGWKVRVPSFRVDVTNEQDLLEEIARHHGFDKFAATLPEWNGAGASLPHEAEERFLRSILMGIGYTEIYTYSFSDEGAERQFRPEVEPVKLLNPMSEDAAVLRTSLIPGMIHAFQWNLNRGMRDLQYYELSKVYRPGKETRSLLLGSTGADRDFYDLKGDVETLLQHFDVSAAIEGSDLPSYYHPGRAARLGQVAIIGELHPEYVEKFKMRQRLYLAEIDVESILKSSRRRDVKSIPRFPSVRRDFSLLLDKGTRYGDLMETIRSAGISEVVHVEPFDRLEEGSFPATKYSLAISVIYQSADRTLTDAEVERFDSKILDLLSTRLHAEQRK